MVLLLLITSNIKKQLLLIKKLITETMPAAKQLLAPQLALAEKARDFASAPFGIIGLECALALYAKALVEDGVIDWPRLIQLLTLAPARLCGLASRVDGIGTLTVGGVADLTLIDPENSWTIRADAFQSKSRNCPFDGWNVRAKPVMTVRAGEILFDATCATNPSQALRAHAPR